MQAFLFVDIVGESRQIKVYDLRSGESKLLIDNAYAPQYAPSGHLLFIRDGDLWAVAFDLESLNVVGTQATVIENVTTSVIASSASYAFSQSGRLIYSADEENTPALRGLIWTDRAGNVEEIPLPPGQYQQPELSPDGQAIALVRMQEGGGSDIWVYDLDRQTFGRRTFSGNALRPTWSPDGRQLAYQELGLGIWSVNADGTGQPVQINNNTTARPASFSSIDGKLHYLEGPIGISSINTLTYRDGAWISSPFINSAFNIWGAAVSPNGRWIAYVSNESGLSQIYVRPYPEIENGKWQISTTTGREPQWGANGDQLFYLEQFGGQGTDAANLFSVAIDDSNGFSPGTPQRLIENVYMEFAYPPNFDVTNDGEKFLFLSNADEGSGSNQYANAELTVIENWFEELKRLAPPDPL